MRGTLIAFVVLTAACEPATFVPPSAEGGPTDALINTTMGTYVVRARGAPAMDSPVVALDAALADAFSRFATSPAGVPCRGSSPTIQDSRFVPSIERLSTQGGGEVYVASNDVDVWIAILSCGGGAGSDAEVIFVLDAHTGAVLATQVATVLGAR
jgi:hypothetical protein